MKSVGWRIVGHAGQRGASVGCCAVHSVASAPTGSPPTLWQPPVLTEPIGKAARPAVGNDNLGLDDAGLHTCSCCGHQRVLSNAMAPDSDPDSLLPRPAS